MKSFEHSLSGNKMQLDRLISAIASALEGSDVPSKLVLRCQLVVEELATNAVQHGGASDVSVRVEITERIRLDIRDDGTAFDPFTVAAPDLSEDLNQRSIGGLGLHLIRSESSVTSYMRDGRFNITSVEIGF